MVLCKKISLVLFLFLGLFLVSATIRVYAEEETIFVDGSYVTRFGSNDYVTIKPFETKDTEFRAVWVSPLVGDITRYSTKEDYQAQMISVLENMEYYHLNVMLFHVRIMNDSLYPSKYSDWSVYYSTNPDWDCLPWLIEECHKRGIEFHAWMNPYRVQNGTWNLSELSKKYRSSNMASNSRNLLQGKNSVILNPGIPEVRDWLVNVCMEVVENYDIDAVHFDDYFYDQGVDDSATQAQYRPSGQSSADWRREQVSIFIHNLSNAIRAYNVEHNRRVELGISPSGVWKADTNRNNGFGTVTYNTTTNMVETEGSRTASASFQHYGEYLYSDTLYWINMEWIDYIIPQTYWALNHPSCPYADLMDWWDEVCSYKNVNVYSGMGLYLHDSSGGYGWYSNSKEAYYQIRYCNGLETVDGYSFFAYSDIKEAVKNNQVMSNVKTLVKNIAILPEIKTQSRITPTKVSNFVVTKNDAGYKLSFDDDAEAKFFVIYRSDKEITYSPEEVIAIIGELGVDGVVEYMDTKASTSDNYYYAVRKQSYSRTLGDGVALSTKNVAEGGLVNLGSVSDFTIERGANNVSCFFSPITYPYGDSINYELTYNFDEGTSRTVKNFQTRSGYKFIQVSIPDGAIKFNATLRAYNNIGESVNVGTINLVSTLKKITNFTINKEVLYNNKKAEFIWNNPNEEGATFIIQESTDSFTWIDLQRVEEESDVFNVRSTVTLSNNSGTIYYRVMMVKGNEYSYSSIISKKVYEYLGDIRNIRIDGTRLRSVTDVNEGDDKVLSWINEEVSYRVLVSPDGDKWTNASIYSSGTTVEINGTTAEIEIGFNYKYMHLFLKIEATDGSKITYSDIYEFYVKTDEVYSDEIAPYIISEFNIFMKEMDLYK